MVYNYFFGHSRSMNAAKVGSNHSKFSISIDNELMNFALCEEKPRTLMLQCLVLGVVDPGVGQVVVKLTMHVLECMLH